VKLNSFINVFSICDSGLFQVNLQDVLCSKTDINKTINIQTFTCTHTHTHTHTLTCFFPVQTVVWIVYLHSHVVRNRKCTEPQL
jgi:hypothetical protein